MERLYWSRKFFWGKMYICLAGNRWIRGTN